MYKTAGLPAGGWNYIVGGSSVPKPPPPSPPPTSWNIPAAGDVLTLFIGFPLFEHDLSPDTDQPMFKIRQIKKVCLGRSKKIDKF